MQNHKSIKTHYINTKKIYSFVRKIERRKSYKEDPGLILRHLFEEVGELSAAVWGVESAIEYVKMTRAEQVAKECVDVISLAVYLAKSVGTDVDRFFDLRYEEVDKQYARRRSGREEY